MFFAVFFTRLALGRHFAARSLGIRIFHHVLFLAHNQSEKAVLFCKPRVFQIVIFPVEGIYCARSRMRVLKIKSNLGVFSSK